MPIHTQEETDSNGPSKTDKRTKKDKRASEKDKMTEKKKAWARAEDRERQAADEDTAEWIKAEREKLRMEAAERKENTA